MVKKQKFKLNIEDTETQTKLNVDNPRKIYTTKQIKNKMEEYKEARKECTGY